MQPDGQTASADFKLCGNHAPWLSQQINAPQNVPMLSFQGWQQLVEAFADHRVNRSVEIERRKRVVIRAQRRIDGKRSFLPPPPLRFPQMVDQR